MKANTNGMHAIHVARRSLVGLQSCKLNDIVGTSRILSNPLLMSFG